MIVIHGNGLDHVPETYRRYLEASFRETFSLQGTPLRVEFRSTRNPFVSHANELITPRTPLPGRPPHGGSLAKMRLH